MTIDLCLKAVNELVCLLGDSIDVLRERADGRVFLDRWVLGTGEESASVFRVENSARLAFGQQTTGEAKGPQGTCGTLGT